MSGPGVGPERRAPCHYSGCGRPLCLLLNNIMAEREMGEAAAGGRLRIQQAMAGSTNSPCEITQPSPPCRSVKIFGAGNGLPSSSPETTQDFYQVKGSVEPDQTHHLSLCWEQGMYAVSAASLNGVEAIVVCITVDNVDAHNQCNSM